MVFIVGDTLRHQPMVAGHMVVPQFRGPITYCVLQWCHPMLTGTQRRTSCSTRMITLFGDHVIKLDSGPRISPYYLPPGRVLYNFGHYSIAGSPNLMEFHSIDKKWVDKIGASPLSPECACVYAFTCSYSVMALLE